MDVLEEFKANLPVETRSAVASMLIRISKEEVDQIREYLSTGKEMRTLTHMNINIAFAEAGYPDTRWKRIMARYERMGHDPRYEFE